MILIQQVRYDEALADLNRALVLGANPAEAHYQIALTHSANGDRPAAIQSLTHALRHSPDYPPAVALQRQLAQHQ
jgi:tetratricopeptide (TPR) repeat protein